VTKELFTSVAVVGCHTIVAKVLLALVAVAVGEALVTVYLVALVAVNTAVGAKHTSAESAFIARFTVVTRLFIARITRLILAAVSHPLVDHRGCGTFHRRTQNIGHERVVQSAPSMHVHSLDASVEVDLLQNR